MQFKTEIIKWSKEALRERLFLLRAIEEAPKTKGSLLETAIEHKENNLN